MANQWDKNNYASYIEENIFYNKRTGQVLKRQVDKELLGKIKEKIKENENLKILDYGCGTGRLISLLQTENIEVKNYKGFDSSIAMLEKALAKFPNMDFDNILNEEKFDLLVCIDVFQHQENIEAIKALISQLKNYSDSFIFAFWVSDNYLYKPVKVHDCEFHEHFFTVGQCKFELFKELKNDYDINFTVFKEDPYDTILVEINKKAKNPNKETLKAINDVNNNINVTTYNSVDNMFKDLNIKNKNTPEKEEQKLTAKSENTPVNILP